MRRRHFTNTQSSGDERRERVAHARAYVVRDDVSDAGDFKIRTAPAGGGRRLCFGG